jgi:hypothetical protein
VSGPIACCGVLWAVGTWSDAIEGAPGVVRSHGACGRCGKELAPVIVVNLCGEALCTEVATHDCHVIGGPVLHFCNEHADRMVAACREAGVSAKIAMRAIAPEPAS